MVSNRLYPRNSFYSPVLLGGMESQVSFQHLFLPGFKLNARAEEIETEATKLLHRWIIIWLNNVESFEIYTCVYSLITAEAELLQFFQVKQVTIVFSSFIAF